MCPVEPDGNRGIAYLQNYLHQESLIGPVIRLSLAVHYKAPSPRSLVRIRIASRISETKIFPSPICPVRAVSLNSVMISSDRSFDTTTSIRSFQGVEYDMDVLRTWHPDPSAVHGLVPPWLSRRPLLFSTQRRQLANPKAVQRPITHLVGIFLTAGSTARQVQIVYHHSVCPNSPLQAPITPIELYRRILQVHATSG